MRFIICFAIAALIAPPILAQDTAVTDVRTEQPRDMRAMIDQFIAARPNTLPSVVDLAARPGTGDLEDTTITCNSETDICTCVSDQSDLCVGMLAFICGTMEPFGENGGVGTDCVGGS